MIIRGADTIINARNQELVAHGTALFPLGCYEEDISREAVRWHWHDDWEIVLATQGIVKIQTTTESINLHAGEAVFLGAGCVHEIIGEGQGCQLRSAVFHPRFISDRDCVIWQRYIQPLQSVKVARLCPEISWQKECIELFQNCWDSLDGEPLGYEIQAREALTRFTLLLYTWLDPRQSKPSEKELRNSKRIKTMLQFIHEHYAEEISTAGIAASANLSESECTRCFRRTINTTPGQYLKNYRLQTAAELLRSTDDKTGNISAACGFTDAAYFTKIFREAMGCTPGEFRKLQRDGNQENFVAGKKHMDERACF